MPAFWTVGAGERPRHAGDAERRAGAARPARSTCREAPPRRSAGSRRAAVDLAVAAVDDRGLQAPYRAPSSVLGGQPRRPAALRHPAVRARADQAPGEGRRLHAQRHRPVPQRRGAAPLPRRARARARPPADRRHPGEPARGRRPVDGHRDRDDGRRAGTNVANPLERLRAINAPPPRQRSTSAGCRPRRGRPTRC